MITILIILIVVIGLWSAWGYFGSRVERAEYKVVKKMNGYEVREYPARIVAQTTVRGAGKEGLVAGFKIVAGYIFGGNVKKESIAMTSPVVAEPHSAKASRGAGGKYIAMTSPVLATVSLRFADQADASKIAFGPNPRPRHAARRPRLRRLQRPLDPALANPPRSAGGNC